MLRGIVVWTILAVVGVVGCLEFPQCSILLNSRHLQTHDCRSAVAEFDWTITSGTAAFFLSYDSPSLGTFLFSCNAVPEMKRDCLAAKFWSVVNLCIAEPCTISTIYKVDHALESFRNFGSVRVSGPVKQMKIWVHRITWPLESNCTIDLEFDSVQGYRQNSDGPTDCLNQQSCSSQDIKCYSRDCGVL
jgi:hypothetical protein